MPISVTCPECNSTYRVGDEAAGKAIKCKKCGARVPVPAAADDDLSALGASGAAGDAPDGDGTKVKKAGGSTKIILIVAGAVVGACCICGGAGGYGVYWAINRAKEGVQDFADKVKKGVDDAAKKAQNNQPGVVASGATILDKTDKLLSTDKQLPGNPGPTKEYKVQLTQGKTYVIDMKRDPPDAKIDPALRLLDPKGKQVADNDDVAPFNYDSQIVIAAPATGQYTIQASTLGTQGPLPPGGGQFRLTVKER